MVRRVPDQAEGLRRLFVGDMRRMVALVGGTATARPLAAGFAAALAGMGKSILLLDECGSAGERNPALGVQYLYDFNTVLAGQAEIEAAVLHVAPDLDVIAGGAQVREPPPSALEARIGLVNAFYRLAGRYDVVLVDTLGYDPAYHPSFAWACQDVVVVCDGVATEAYAHIKQLHHSGERNFHLLFASMEVARAQAVYKTVAAVCRRHLHLMPEYFGVLEPQDSLGFSHLARQMLVWPLPENKTGHFSALMQRLLPGTKRGAMATTR